MNDIRNDQRPDGNLPPDEAGKSNASEKPGMNDAGQNREGIVSLVPSLTELVFSLGLGHRLAGRTRFCIHPAGEVSRVPIVGGTKNPRIDKIKAISPGLVLANREENRREDVQAMREFTGVLVSEISSVDEALGEIRRIGVRLGVEERAGRLVDEIEVLIPSAGTFENLRALYLIWREPWMVAGGDTYIHDVMRRFGLENAAGGMQRYPELSVDEMHELRPDVVLLSSEPYPFGEKHVREMEGMFTGDVGAGGVGIADGARGGNTAEDAEDAEGTQRKGGGFNAEDAEDAEGTRRKGGGAGRTKVLLVDGEWFSWYGPRMAPSFRALAEWRQKI